MTHENSITFIKDCIRKISETFSKNPDIYFCESDLQSDLFALLAEKLNKEVEIKNTFMWGTDKPKNLRKVSTRKLHSELLLPEGRIDLAVLDLDRTVFTVNANGHNPGIRIKDGNHIFIEIKASRTSRSSIPSKNRWYKLIISDIEKLNKYTNQCYMLCFDFSHILNEHEISSIHDQANNNIEFHYIKNNNPVSYIDINN